MFQAQMLARQRMQSLLKTRSRSLKGRTRDLGGRLAGGWAVRALPRPFHRLLDPAGRLCHLFGGPEGSGEQPSSPLP